MLDDVCRGPQSGLADPDPGRRAESVRVCRTLSALTMAAALIDPDPMVRVAALWQLHVIITAAPPERALYAPAPEVCIRASFRLGVLSPAQPRRAVDDRNPLVADAAAVRLARQWYRRDGRTPQSVREGRLAQWRVPYRTPRKSRRPARPRRG